MEGPKQPEVSSDTQHLFEFWREAFAESNPEIQLPREGTASDIFKAVLRHFLAEYGAKLQVETITNIELRYMVQPDLGPEDFFAAEKLIEKDLEK